MKKEFIPLLYAKPPLSNLYMANISKKKKNCTLYILVYLEVLVDNLQVHQNIYY